MSGALTRDAILAKRQPKRELVDVPELEGSVYVRSLGGRELTEFIQRSQKVEDADYLGHFNVMVDLITKAVVDEHGAQLFGGEDADAIAALPLKVLRALTERARSLSGLDGDALGKDSAETSGSATSSGSAPS